MKNFIAGISCIVLVSFIQNPDMIPWQAGTMLSWDNFKGNPDNASPYKALTESTVQIAIKPKGDSAFITLQTYFDKNKSWVKQEKSPYLLNHEQIHFNIVEVWARKFRQKLKGKTFAIKMFQSQLNAMHAEIHNGSHEEQALYDKETEHSLNKPAQEKWNKKIGNELKLLQAFSSPAVSCKLIK